MARRIEPAAPPAAGETPAAEQLAELHPELSLTIAGRPLVLREYGFYEGLEVAHKAQALIADMHQLCRDGALRFDRIRRLLGVHRQVVIPIAAQSAGVDPEWVAGLEGNDAETFLSAWFGVNAGFFVHEVVVEMREERVLAAMTAQAGPSSSPGSAPPDSATSTASADTPSDS